MKLCYVWDYKKTLAGDYCNPSWIEIWMSRQGCSYPTYFKSVLKRAAKYKGWLSPVECDSIRLKFLNKYRGNYYIKGDYAHTPYGYPRAEKVCPICGRIVETDYCDSETEDCFMVPVFIKNSEYLVAVPKCGKSCRDAREHWGLVWRQKENRAEVGEYFVPLILNAYLKNLIREIKKDEKNRKNIRRTEECTV